MDVHQILHFNREKSNSLLFLKVCALMYRILHSHISFFVKRLSKINAKENEKIA